MNKAFAAGVVERMRPRILEIIDELITTPFRPDAEGYLTTPTGPGLGVELNREALKRYAI